MSHIVLCTCTVIAARLEMRFQSLMKLLRMLGVQEYSGTWKAAFKDVNLIPITC